MNPAPLPIFDDVGVIGEHFAKFRRFMGVARGDD
jgi:hypothetical protein